MDRRSKNGNSWSTSNDMQLYGRGVRQQLVLMGGQGFFDWTDRR